MRKELAALVVCTAVSGTAMGQDFFRGRVVAGVENAGIVVNLERQNGQILAQAMTDSRGAFTFSDPLSAETNDSYAFLVVEAEGFQEYRQRLARTDIQGGGLFTIYLEPERGAAAGAGGGAIDVGQLLAEIPEEAREEYERALEDIADEDHDDAVERLERAVELAPDFYDAWIDLGGQLNALENYDDAKGAYESARDLNPNGALAYVNLGALYYQEGERHAAEENAVEAMGTFFEAHAALERAVELDPVSVEGRFYMGATLYRLAEFEQAAAQLQAAVDIGDGYPQARLMLINVYNRQRLYDRALEQANLFIDENPDAPERDAIERVRGQLEAALQGR